MKKLLILFALAVIFIIGGNHDAAFAIEPNDYESINSVTSHYNGRENLTSFITGDDFSKCFFQLGSSTKNTHPENQQTLECYIITGDEFHVIVKYGSYGGLDRARVYGSDQDSSKNHLYKLVLDFKASNAYKTYGISYIKAVCINYLLNNVIDNSCESITAEMWDFSYDFMPRYTTYTLWFYAPSYCVFSGNNYNVYLDNTNFLQYQSDPSEVYTIYQGIPVLQHIYMPGAQANVIGVTNTLAWSANSNIQNANDNLYPYGNKWQIRIDNVNPNAKYRFVYKIACPTVSYLSSLKTTVALSGLFSDDYFLEYDENYYPYFNMPNDYLFLDYKYRFRQPLNSSLGAIDFKEISDGYSVEVMGSNIPDGRVNIDLSALIESRTNLRNTYGNDIKAASVLAYITDVWTYVTETDLDTNRSWYGDINVFRTSFQDFPKNPNFFITAQNEYSNPIPPVSSKIQNPNNTINDSNIESIVNYPTENPDNDPESPSYNPNYNNINNTTNQDLTNAQQAQIDDLTNGQYNQFDDWFQNVTEPDTSINSGVFQSVSDLALSASKLSDVVRNFLTFLPPEIMSMILAIFVVMVPVIVIKLFM